jgi:hypothetical protein
MGKMHNTHAASHVANILVVVNHFPPPRPALVRPSVGGRGKIHAAHDLAKVLVAALDHLHERRQVRADEAERAVVHPQPHANAALVSLQARFTGLAQGSCVVWKLN